MHTHFTPKGMALTLVVAMLTAPSAWADNSVTATTPEGRVVTVTALTDNIIKVDNTLPDEQLPVSKAAVITEATTHATTSTVGSVMMSLSTPTGLLAMINTATGEVVIDGGADKVVTDRGLRQSSDGKLTLSLSTTARGSYYGAGERGHSLNLRGDTLVMYNRQNYGYTKGDPRINQMNITMPLFIASDGFAVLFDDYAAASMFLGSDAQIEYVTENPHSVSYYYINGARDIADVTEQLTGLTGRQPLPPLWSLGYITSKYGYHNEAETLGAVDSLKTRGYPVDGIVLDLYWYGKEQDMGRLAWDPVQWPDPEGMLKKLKDENVNLIAISQPYVLRNGQGADNYDYLAPRGMLMADSTGLAPQEVVIWVGEGGMFDVSNPATRQWMADRYQQLTDMGISGWWGDLGEPEVHPQTGIHANGLTARQYHNQYGNDWSQIIYDLFAEKYPDTRLVTMMRGGTTGLQRYSVFPWSTDVSRSWEGMQPQVTIMLNSGLSGLGYMGHDVGGFAIDPANPVDPELYVRWLQLGLFSPMLRTHAQYNAEPYHYPEYADIILPLVKARYRWLPYNYTLAYENAAYGYPLVRPLNFNEPGVNAYDLIDDEYLWGSEVLVAPVMQQSATSRQVTFPQGQWVDMANPSQVYQGGTTIDYPAPLSMLPLFARAGAFIPQATNTMESTADYNPARLNIDYYPVKGVESVYTMYDDDRISPQSLASGQYRLVTFDGRDDGEQIQVKIAAEGTYEGAPKKLNYVVVFRGVSPKGHKVKADCGRLSVVSVDGYLGAAIQFDPATQSPTITVQR